jgi:hypothetical protein
VLLKSFAATSLFNCISADQAVIAQTSVVGRIYAEALGSVLFGVAAVQFVGCVVLVLACKHFVKV